MLLVRPMRKLNPLLKLAAISGVETAIKLHIRRGDDLDAGDGAGATPLILAAAKRRLGAVRLLLDAGANPALEDNSGNDALASAIKGGCPETVALLAAALARRAASESFETPPPENLEPLCDEDEVASLGEPVELPRPLQPPFVELCPHFYDDEPDPRDIADPPSEQDRPDEAGVATVLASVKVVEVVSLDDEALEELSVDGWEAEEDVSAPEGDETVAEAARQVHEVLGRHKAVDRDEGWEDVDLHLPERAAPLARDEGDGAVKALLLTALREGMVSEDDLIEVCANADCTRNEEAERLLAVVAGELGATVVEWTGPEESFRRESSLEEDRLLTEALVFADDLASGRNDPFRFYSRDMRGGLLDADEEITLGREMEEAGQAALSALARWPEGLSALFEVADQVANGEADVESFCSGPEPSSEDEPASRGGRSNEDDEESGLNAAASYFVSAIEAVKAAQGDAQSAIKALQETRLTRRFLLELTDQAVAVGAGREFVEAIERQSAARERMILSNLRLAYSIAKKYLWSDIPLDDLVQEANIGLMTAVERFDWRRGFRFSTYATWWIRQRVTRSIADTARVVRAPVHIQETARRVLRERNEAEIRLGRPERETETAQRIGVSRAKAHMLLSMFEDVVSLDDVDPDTGLLRVDCLPDTNGLDPADFVEFTSLRSTLLGMLDDFDERSREVILLRFGLAGEDAMTLEEVGQHFGVTRERIRQVESKAMRRLSLRTKREILWPFMGDGYDPNAPSSLEEKRSPRGRLAEHSASVVQSPRPPREIRSGERQVRFAEAAAAHSLSDSSPTPHEPTTLDDLASRMVDEARALGLRVHDRRPQGGQLIIVAPFASSPAIRAFGRKLLDAGFRKIQKDVFSQ